ncbi:MAG: RidA family protein [Reyranellaceae bacterium]
MTTLQTVAPSNCFRGDVPLSLAVKAGHFVFVSGIPAFAEDGAVAVDDFPAQLRQVMANIDAILREAGGGWDRVVRTRVYLTRPTDVADMNRLYAAHFPDGKYPARTTLIVQALPRPEFLVEIECEAVLS